MKRNINIVVGVISLMNVIYKLATCISCVEYFFTVEVSGLVYLTIWSIITIIIFSEVFRTGKNAKQLK